jgi:hypothetical protein
VALGRRVIVHPGSVLGGDGFGYVFDGQAHRKIPQVGRVVVEDDVEIGANVTVDRATLGETVSAGNEITTSCSWPIPWSGGRHHRRPDRHLALPDCGVVLAGGGDTDHVRSATGPGRLAVRVHRELPAGAG